MKKTNDCTRYVGSDEKVYSLWTIPNKSKMFQSFMVECDKEYLEIAPIILKQFAFTLDNVLDEGTHNDVTPNKPSKHNLEYYDNYIGFDVTIEKIHHFSFDIDKNTKFIMFEDISNQDIHMRSDGFKRTIKRREAKEILELVRDVLIQSGHSKDMKKEKEKYVSKTHKKSKTTSSSKASTKLCYNNKGENVELIIPNSAEEDSDLILKRSIWTTKYGKKKHIRKKGGSRPQYFCGAYNSTGMDTKISHIEDPSELTLGMCTSCKLGYRKRYSYEIRNQSKTI